MQIFKLSFFFIFFGWSFFFIFWVFCNVKYAYILATKNYSLKIKGRVCRAIETEYRLQNVRLVQGGRSEVNKTLNRKKEKHYSAFTPSPTGHPLALIK